MAVNSSQEPHSYLENQKVPRFDENIDPLEGFVVVSIEHDSSVDFIFTDASHVDTSREKNKKL